MGEPVFVPQQVIDFQCIMCGKCCGDWHINFEKTAHEFLEAHLPEINPALAIDDILMQYDAHYQTEKRYSFLKFRNRRCELVEDNKCAVFKRFGKDTGALVCRTFPVYNFKTPRGIFYAISFFCTASSRGLLKPEKFNLVKNPQNIKPILKIFKDFSLLPYVKFGFRQLFSWEAYYLLEDFLLKMRNKSGITLEQKILMIAHFLNLAGSSGEKIVDDKKFSPLSWFFWDTFDKNIHEIHNHHGNIMHQIKTVKFLIDRKRSLYPDSSFREAIADVYDLFCCDSDTAAKRFTERLAVYNTLIAPYSYILENYFFNKLNYNTFLIERGISGGFETILFLYVFVRFLLIARLEHTGDKTAAILSAVYDAEKYFAHDLKVFEFFSRTTKEEPYILLSRVEPWVKID